MDSDVMTLTDIIGDWGPWQLKLIIFFTLANISTGLNNFASLFYAPRVQYYCVTQNDENVTSTDQCYTSSGEQCSQWTYDTSTFESTIISEWDLVCGRSWLASACFSVYEIGFAISGVSCGYLSDKYGRLFIYRIWLCFEILSALAVITSISIYMFMVAQCLLGFSVFGRCMTGLLLRPGYRGLTAVIHQFGLLIGYMILPGIAYLLRNFRYIQLVSVVSQIIFFFGLKWIPESPRWQLTDKKYTECEINIIQASIMNNKANINEEEIRKKIKILINLSSSDNTRKSKENKPSLINLWTEPTLLKYCLLLYYGFFVNTFVYYGLSLNVGDLGGNLFIDSIIYAFSEIVANGLLYFALVKFGRRTLYVTFVFGASMSCFGVVPLLLNDSLKSYRIVIAMFGKFCVSCTFTILYLQAAELMPTPLRQLGVGSCSIVGRIGSMTAPFVKELSQSTHASVSMAIFGSVSFVNAVLALLLPETKGCEIPDTIEEMRSIRLKKCSANHTNVNVNVHNSIEDTKL